MKKALLILTLSTFLAACNNAAQSPATSSIQQTSTTAVNNKHNPN
ncbi:MAG: hypothetical protein Q4B82_06330 [Alysiella sp.]|nr:hypothetical protein [Alysiella sp.]MDO4434178.1 hypothetical protein [Alysiella sp.]